MKVTGNDNEKHRQLQIEDYLQMVSAEQKEYAEVCGSPRIIENNITNTNAGYLSFMECYTVSKV